MRILKRTYLLYFFIFITGVISFVSCIAKSHNVEQNIQFNYEVTTVSYLGVKRKEKMDVYRPLPSHKLKPAVLLIHGGGWATGSKNSKREKAIAVALVEQGYAVFSIDYHLTKFDGEIFKSKIKKPGWPQNIYDCKSAVRYIRKNASIYNIDPNAIGVLGCSAGGHLALLTALTSKNKVLNSGGLYKDISSDVSCVVSFYGIPDIRTWGGGSFMGINREEYAGQWALASPVTHLTAKSPPVLLVHGDSDKTVNVSLSIDFAKELEKKKVTHELVIVEGGEHSFNLNTSKYDLGPVLFKFFEGHIGSVNKGL